MLNRGQFSYSSLDRPSPFPCIEYQRSQQQIIPINKSFQQIQMHKKPRSKSLPLKTTKQSELKINDKIIPIRYEYNSLKSVKKEQIRNEVPQFWGCIVPSHYETINRRKFQKLIQDEGNANKKKNKSHEKPLERKAKSIDKSEMLLTKYLKRKFKRKESEPMDNNNNKSSSRSHNRSCPITILPKLSTSMQMEHVPITNIVDTSSSSSPQKVDQFSRYHCKEDERSTRISELNEVIKWRSKLISKIQTELDLVKNSEVWRY